MKICGKCVLPESFPGVKLDDKGICNFCDSFRREGDLDSRKKKYRERFNKILQEYRGKGPYDALLSYSGGKDSTYTMALLKEEYGMNILAFTMDHGFIPEQTFRNIRTVSEKLGVDHILLKPSFQMLHKVFKEAAKKNLYSPATLTRASTICTSCMIIVRFSSLRLALEKRIPILAFGWSPGQIPLSASILKNNPKMIRTMQSAGLKPLQAIVGEAVRPYFLEEDHFQDPGRFPYNISPLAFLDYDGKKIREKVERLGWEKPTGLDVHTTNCLLNSLANVIHKKSFGFSPYTFELAKLVREGYLERREALDRLEQSESAETVRLVKKKLSL